MERCLLILFLIAGSLATAFSQYDGEKSVHITATVDASASAITLHWQQVPWVILDQKLYRRKVGTEGWGLPHAQLNVAATSYSDTEIDPGLLYEYQIVRNFSEWPHFATGYLMSGIDVPLEDNPGSVLLVVENDVSIQLPSELSQFENDLRIEGWRVYRTLVDRFDTVASVKTKIVNQYTTTPDLRTVICVGHVPVPYSGNISPDEHTNHHGAWPADMFYGEMDGLWTDTVVTQTGNASFRNDNIPGDGKYDQSRPPSPVDLEVGRIDFDGMSLFGTEIVSVANYFEKLHNYRVREGAYTTFTKRGLIAGDATGYRGDDTFSSNAWWNFTPLFGSDEITHGDWFDGAGSAETEPYLWGLGAGSGSYSSISSIGSSSHFATRDSKVMFTMFLGSYLGDWDTSNNFLRAPLASSRSDALASMWIGRPHWHIHSIAMGKTLGYGTRVTQNNIQDYAAGLFPNFVHLALMGDPTIRMFPPQPVTGLSADSSIEGQVLLQWDSHNSPDLLGYVAYRYVDERFQRIHSNLITINQWTDRSFTPGEEETYLIRAVVRETTASGSFQHAGHGDIVTLTPPEPLQTTPELNVSASKNGAPIGNGSSTPLASHGTDFGSVDIDESSAPHVFILTNSGSDSLMLDSQEITGIGFTLDPSSETLIAPGESTSISVSFHPELSGLHTGTITINSNDQDESTFTFIVSGKGVATPAIATSSTSIETILRHGETGTDSLTITNTGSAPLSYSFHFPYSALHFPAQAPHSPYVWLEISTTGTEITNWFDWIDPLDNGYTNNSISMGINFPYYGENYTHLFASVNGWISFTDQLIQYHNKTLPCATAPASIVAGCWQDLFLDADSGVYYTTVDADTFVIQYENVADRSDLNQRITFQMIFKSTGEILFQYKDVGLTDAAYTVGIQNQTRDEGVTALEPGEGLTGGCAIRFEPPQSWWSSPSPSGIIPTGNTTTEEIFFDFQSQLAGHYSGSIEIRSNAPTTPSLLVPLSGFHLLPIAAWKQQYFPDASPLGEDAPQADPDGDGFDNQLEYALGGNPLVEDASLIFTPAFVDNGEFSLVFQRDPLNTDVHLYIDGSDDLVEWEVIGESLHGMPFAELDGINITEQPGLSGLEVEVNQLSTGPRRFLRLRAEVIDQ